MIACLFVLVWIALACGTVVYVDWLQRDWAYESYLAWRRAQFVSIDLAEASRLHSVGAWGANDVVLDNMEPSAAVLLAGCDCWRRRRLL